MVMIDVKAARIGTEAEAKVPGNEVRRAVSTLIPGAETHVYVVRYAWADKEDASVVVAEHRIQQNRDGRTVSWEDDAVLTREIDSILRGLEVPADETRPAGSMRWQVAAE